MKVYKVVHQTKRGKFISLYVRNKYLCLTYLLNKELKRPNKPIFTFSNLNDAQNYALTSMDDWYWRDLDLNPVILECEAEVTQKVPKRGVIDEQGILEIMSLPWESHEDFHKMVFCSSVTPKTIAWRANNE